MGRVKAFDDLYSWLHFAYAAVVTALSPIAAVAAAILYVAYQRYEKERWECKRGDFIEFEAGILAALLAEKLLPLIH